MLYSHIWDGLLKLALMFAVVIALMRFHFTERLESAGASSNVAVALLVAVAVVVWAAIYRQGLSTVAVWLYATVSLGARVSMAEARQLARLFQLDLSFKWIPLKEVRHLPKAERRNALLTALAAVGPSRKTMFL